jgi:hypothetical protein
MGYTTGETVETSALMSGLPEMLQKYGITAAPIQPTTNFAPR